MTTTDCETTDPPLEVRSGAWFSSRGWEPGDPLWVRPRSGGGASTQYVRPMIELLSDASLHSPSGPRTGHLNIAGLARCTRCEVWWNPLELDVCWVCEGKKPTTTRLPIFGRNR